MFNNIQVTLVAFAGGISFGVLTVYALFFNGLILGVIGGLAIGAGNGVAFLRLVSSHGPLEISCIVAGGIAGLRVGWALIRPGALRRGTSLRREALPAVEIAAGTIPWLVLCGFLEGFATGPDLPVEVQATLGASLFVLFWSLVVLQRTARDFARRYAATTVAGSFSGGASSTARPGGPEPRGDLRAGVEDVARDHAARILARGERGQAGSVGLATTTAWRLDRTGTASTSGRAAASSSRSTKTTTSARLEPSARRKAAS